MALEIERVFNDEFAPHRLTTVTSSGSLENLRRLETGLTDWAIIQRNVAAQGYFDDQFRRIEILLPLFPEALQIFVRDMSAPDGVIRFGEFIDRCRDGRIRELAAGPVGSGSLDAVKMILSLWGIGPSDDIYYEASTKGTIEAFSDGSVDALALMWAYPFEGFRLSDDGAVALVSMEPEDLARALGHSDHFDRATIPSGSYDFATRPVHTVATWALLVARSAAGARRVSALAGNRSLSATLLHHALNEPGFARVADALDLPVPSGEAGSARRWRHTSFFRGLPLSGDLKKELGHLDLLRLGIRVLALLAILGAIVAASWPGFRRRLRRNNDPASRRELRRHWTRYKHHVLAFILFLAVFVLFAAAIQLFETRFYHQHLVYTPFRDLDLITVVRWLFIFSISNYGAGLFPASPGGQLATAFAIPAMYGCFVLAVVGEIVVGYRERRRRSGMMSVKYTHHVVICGFNNHLVRIVEKFQSGNGQHSDKRRFLLIDPRIKELLESNESLRDLHSHDKIDFIHGEATEQAALDRANLHEADTVILLADDNTRAADERTLLRALIVSRHCCEKLKETTLDSIYMIAELNNPEYRQRLLECDVNEVVCGSELTENLLVQSAYNHGLSDCLDSILTYNDWNEFYLEKMIDHPELVGWNFDQLLHALREERALLVAIKVGFVELEGRLGSNPVSRELIDREKIEDNLREMRLRRQILTNPLSMEEDDYSIRPDDSLLLLAQDETAARSALHRAASAGTKSTFNWARGIDARGMRRFFRCGLRSRS